MFAGGLSQSLRRMSFVEGKMTPVMQVTDVRVAENSIECMMSETVSWMRAPTLARCTTSSLLRLGMHPGVRRCPWGQQVLRRIAAEAER